MRLNPFFLGEMTAPLTSVCVSQKIRVRVVVMARNCVTLGSFSYCYDRILLCSVMFSDVVKSIGLWHITNDHFSNSHPVSDD